jgi:hypothetical protein
MGALVRAAAEDVRSARQAKTAGPSGPTYQ